MLFADPTDRNLPSVAGSNRDSEDGLGQPDPFGMVAERAVAKVRQLLFRPVEPAMDFGIVLREFPPNLRAEETAW